MDPVALHSVAALRYCDLSVAARGLRFRMATDFVYVQSVAAIGAQQWLTAGCAGVGRQ